MLTETYILTILCFVPPPNLRIMPINERDNSILGRRLGSIDQLRVEFTSLRTIFYSVAIEWTDRKIFGIS